MRVGKAPVPHVEDRRRHRGPVAVPTDGVDVPPDGPDDALARQGPRNDGDPVPDLRGLLEPHPRGERDHLRFPSCKESPVLPPEESHRVVDDGEVPFPRDQAGARAETPSHLVVEARPRAGGEFPPRAGAEREEAEQFPHGFPDPPRRGERTEIRRPVARRPADQLGARERLVPVDPQEQVLLVVAEKNVEGGAVPLDEGVLEEEGLLLRGGNDAPDLPDPRDEIRDRRPPVPARNRIVPDAGPQILRLPHVQDLPPAVAHDVDAGGARERLPVGREPHRCAPVHKYGNICPLTIQTPGSRGGFHSATLATFDRSLRFRSTQSLPLSIRRCVEPPRCALRLRYRIYDGE